MSESSIEVTPRGANFPTSVKLIDIIHIEPDDGGSTITIQSAPTDGSGPTTVELPVTESEQEVRKRIAQADPRS